MVTQNEEPQTEQPQDVVVEPTSDVTVPTPDPTPEPEPQPEPVPAVVQPDQSAEIARLQAQNAQYAQQAAVAEQQRQQQEQQNQLRTLQTERQRQLETSGWYPEQAAQEAASWARAQQLEQSAAQQQAALEAQAKGVVAQRIAMQYGLSDPNSLLGFANPNDMENAAKNMVAANGQIKQLTERIAFLEKAQQPAQNYDSGQGTAVGGYGSRDAVESAYIRGDINTDAYRKEMARYER
jgi:multidrug efflux pump subunit AcrA (membrane-fusion protein)|tara:strand:- start:274 stop:984 length:711 start_codon:yes stop_codon:yes gene_type:complete